VRNLIRKILNESELDWIKDFYNTEQSDLEKLKNWLYTFTDLELTPNYGLGEGEYDFTEKDESKRPYNTKGSGYHQIYFDNRGYLESSDVIDWERLVKNILDFQPNEETSEWTIKHYKQIYDTLTKLFPDRYRYKSKPKDYDIVESTELDWIRDIEPELDRYFDINVCYDSFYDEETGEDECLDGGSYFIKIPSNIVPKIWDYEVEDYYFAGPGDEGEGVINWAIDNNKINQDEFDDIQYVYEISKEEYCRAWGKWRDEELCSQHINESDEFNWIGDVKETDFWNQEDIIVYEDDEGIGILSSDNYYDDQSREHQWIIVGKPNHLYTVRLIYPNQIHWDVLEEIYNKIHYELTEHGIEPKNEYIYDEESRKFVVK
jgi:hypothetical protein